MEPVGQALDCKPMEAGSIPVTYSSNTKVLLTDCKVIEMSCCRKFIADVEFIYEMKKQTPLGDH